MGDSSNYKRQDSRKLATQFKEHRAATRNYTIKASIMASKRGDTGHDIDLIEVKILNRAISWTTSSFKEAWLSNENAIEKCHRLTQFCERQSINGHS